MFPANANTEQRVMILLVFMVCFCISIVVTSLCIIIIRDGNSQLINDITSKMVDMVIATLTGLIASFGIYLKFYSDQNNQKANNG